MKTEPSRIAQMHFEFKDWQKAFETWDENLLLYGNRMQMVISQGSYTSGYWIEYKGCEIMKGDVVYDTNEKVQELKERVKFAISEDLIGVTY